MNLHKFDTDEGVQWINLDNISSILLFSTPNDAGYTARLIERGTTDLFIHLTQTELQELIHVEDFLQITDAYQQDDGTHNVGYLRKNKVLAIYAITEGTDRVRAHTADMIGARAVVELTHSILFAKETPEDLLAQLS